MLDLGRFLETGLCFFARRGDWIYFAFDKAERKPNFGLWLCRVSCPV